MVFPKKVPFDSPLIQSTHRRLNSLLPRRKHTQHNTNKHKQTNVNKPLLCNWTENYRFNWKPLRFASGNKTVPTVWNSSTLLSAGSSRTRDDSPASPSLWNCTRPACFPECSTWSAENHRVTVCVERNADEVSSLIIAHFQLCFCFWHTGTSMRILLMNYM